jgi:hypothetical protein
MLKNFGFFALGLIAAALAIWAFKKMKKSPAETEEVLADNTTDSGGSMSGGTSNTTTSGGGMG